MATETLDREIEEISQAYGADQCKLLRAAYKARCWNLRAISVKNDEYSMGSTIHVTIKKVDVVDFAEARRLAGACESVRYCSISGDILSGGNRFLRFGYSEEANAELSAPVLEAVRVAMAAAQDDQGALLRVEGTALRIKREDRDTWAVWGDGFIGQTWDSGDGATLAEMIGRTMYEGNH